MPFIPTENAVRCAIRYRLFEQDVVNTLWLHHDTGAISASDLMEVPTLLRNKIPAILLPFLTQDISLADITATDQTTSDSFSYTLAFSGDDGEVTNPGLPSTNCITVTFRTLNRGRSGRGRNYIAGLYETGVVGNVVDPDLIADVVSVYDGLIANPIDNWTWGVVSLEENGDARSEGLFQPVVAVGVSDSFVDSQRKRGGSVSG